MSTVRGWSRKKSSKLIHQAREHESALHILSALMRGYPGSLTIQLWNGTQHTLGNASGSKLVFHHPSVLRELMMRPNPVQLADAYFSGLLDFDGDLFEVIVLKHHFESLVLNWRDKFDLLRHALRLPTRQRQQTSDHSGRFPSKRSRHCAQLIPSNPRTV